ncbi:MAG: amidohydrolase [Firmicutes bacterium]|nr:amidohydrolase [Bacillota bacterium]
MAKKKVYYNGVVYTADADRRIVTAVVTEGDRILYAGDDEGAKAAGGADAELQDLEGKMLLPGFIDGHCHPIMAACLLSGIVLDIDWTTEQNLAEIRRYVAEHPDQETYIGSGYAEWNFDEHGPAKELLDEICADRPMIILGSGGHEAWANSKAFEAVGITKDTPDPVPGLHYYARDPEGNPSGHVAESQAMDVFFEKVNFFNTEAMEAMLEQISADYASYGVTTTADMGVTLMIGEENYRTGLSLIRDRGYRQRFNGPGLLVADEALAERALSFGKSLREEYDDDRIRISLYKIINDGTMESRTAANSEPYPEDGSVVEPLLDGPAMADIALKAIREGFDLNVHAIGDNAVKSVVEAAKAIRQAGFEDTRITCSHCQYIDPADVPAFAQYDITANSTGVWFYGNPLMDKVLGHINDETFRMRSLRDAGARVAFGSDFPVDEYGNEPLKSIEMAVTRRMYDQPDAPMLKPYDEALTVEDGILGYTIHNAIQLHMEDRLGSIEPGKYADLVILEENLLEVEPAHIHNVKVRETIIGGETVYKAEG